MRKLAAILCAAVGCHRPSAPGGPADWTRDALDLGDGALIDAMVAHPILIERPIVVLGDKVALCRPSETVRDLLG